VLVVVFVGEDAETVAAETACPSVGEAQPANATTTPAATLHHNPVRIELRTVNPEDNGHTPECRRPKLVNAVVAANGVEHAGSGRVWDRDRADVRRFTDRYVTTTRSS
jgi:hypothetical protein